jgi:hypothetical protein
MLMLQTMWYVGCCTAEYVVDILLSMPLMLHAEDFVVGIVLLWFTLSDLVR